MAKRTARHYAHRDGVLLQFKVGSKRAVTGNIEIVGGSSTHHSTLRVGPVDKLITCGRVGCKLHFRTMVEAARSSYRTGIGWTDNRRNSIGDGAEITCHRHVASRHGELVIHHFNRGTG